jgi:hypothetical protein
MAELRTRSTFARDSAIVLFAVSGAALIFHFKHHNSIRNHKGVATAAETLNVEKGTERYHVEAGKEYVPVSDRVTSARIESSDGNWFAVSKNDGTVFRDCAKEPVEITVASKREVSIYRVRACGGGRRLTMTGR